MKIIITGATGMVGEGVLHECLNDAKVTQILVVGRKSCGITHPKLKEILHADFFDLTPIVAQLKGYDACLFCLGISSIGVAKDVYFKNTYTLTMHFASVLKSQNDNLVFCYVSGAGTSSSASGNGWAAVKGRVERELIAMGFKDAYAFRPGFIRPIAGLRHTHGFYKYVTWLYPVTRALYKKGFCTMQELAKAMINVCQKGYEKQILEGDDIIKAAAA